MYPIENQANKPHPSWTTESLIKKMYFPCVNVSRNLTLNVCEKIYYIISFISYETESEPPFTNKSYNMWNFCKRALNNDVIAVPKVNFSWFE